MIEHDTKINNKTVDFGGFEISFYVKYMTICVCFLMCSIVFVLEFSAIVTLIYDSTIQIGEYLWFLFACVCLKREIVSCILIFFS